MITTSLHATIARVTGDTLATINRLGFSHKRRSQPELPDRDDPLAVVDCPCCGGTVVLAWNRTDDLPEFADCRRCETVFPYSESEVYEADLLDVQVQAPRALAPAA
jgi:hypothetical protein